MKAGRLSLRNVLMGAVALFLLVSSVINIRVLKPPLSHLLHGKIHGVHDFIDEVQDAYATELLGKEGFINLNGWFANRLDQTVCNKVVKLKNGMLTDVGKEKDMRTLSDRMTELQSFLEGQGIEFLYIQAPYKVDLAKQLLPEGIRDERNESADRLIAGLQQGGVDVLDLRGTFSATPADVEQNFFSTDHHWNYTAALRSGKIILRKLQEIFPGRDIDGSLAGPENWEAHTLEDWFLGSHGKRVGIYYGGTDDITYYTPKFPTELSCIDMSTLEITKGDFTKACMELSLTQTTDYFQSNNYRIYGTDTHYKYINPAAPNDMRILWVMDSFSKPVLAFLSTMFREIDIIDPRDKQPFAIAEYAAVMHPDIVIMMQYPVSICDYSTKYSFGTEAAAAKDFRRRRTVLSSRDVTVNATEARYAAVPVTPEAGQSYILEFDDVELTASGDISGGVGICLYDAERQKTLATGILDVEYCREYGGFRWYFTTPENPGKQPELRFYAGMPDDGGVTRAVYRNVHLDVIGAAPVLP